jgi:hypothetical protein
MFFARVAERKLQNFANRCPFNSLSGAVGRVDFVELRLTNGGENCARDRGRPSDLESAPAPASDSGLL